MKHSIHHRSLSLGIFALTVLASWISNRHTLGDDLTDAFAKPTTVQIADQSVTLPPPTLAADLDSDAQQRRITPLLRGLSFKQFARDSVVAPVRIYLRYITNEAGDRVGHDVHMIFIIHESLQTFSDQNIAKRLSGEASDDATAQTSSDVSAETLQSLGIDDAGPEVRYRNVEFELLDKIQLTGLLRIAQQSSATQNRIDVSLVETFDNRWRFTDGRESDATGSSGEYSGFQGWLTATSLAGMDAVFVEARFVMHEPKRWFAGSNYVRSKLPLVLQEAARDLRRRFKAGP
ncbi:hypothetical protein Mal15_13130 [Stieleria maiorica]|uniref:Uncharacterized protein n=1 Tax=Stieleria maiorica TaxID=2795974 RepID=A0A5B9MCD8_9BACT|nr:hypothetical protein [Stieleria maiorica]QEF97274.1 hypothetical protein Mal15_13130 [Stieleria maiorica]